MQAIGFYLALPFLYFISILPPWILYGLSDVLCFVLYDVAGYRRKVTEMNLAKSFPEKTLAERKIIMRKFYHFLCDFFLETFKTLTMSRVYAAKHCSFDSAALALFNRYYASGKSIIVVMGHFGNWEWAGQAFSLQCKQHLLAIYHPLSNSYYNRLIINMRSRFGTQPVEMEETFKTMVRLRQEVTTTAFIADQTPPPDKAYWTTFLNQDTPVYKGTEVIARKLNYPVVFASVRRVQRGSYKIFVETLFENPSQTADGEITESHTRKLETEIKRQPEIWLWSHRRWKHKRG